MEQFQNFYSKHYLSSVVLNQGYFAPELGEVGGVLLASGEGRPGMLLNILQCTGQLPTTKNYLAKIVNRLRNPFLT